MSSKTDWVPKPDKEFSDFFERYVKIVPANTALSKPVWTHIPDERINELSHSYGDWIMAYDKFKTPTPRGTW